MSQFFLTSDEHHDKGGLKRVLTVRDLTFFGIAAILGAGSFSSLGGAVFHGGPVSYYYLLLQPLPVHLLLFAIQNLPAVYRWQAVPTLMLMLLSENCLPGSLAGH